MAEREKGVVGRGQNKGKAKLVHVIVLASAPGGSLVWTASLGPSVGISGCPMSSDDGASQQMRSDHEEAPIVLASPCWAAGRQWLLSYVLGAVIIFLF